MSNPANRPNHVPELPDIVVYIEALEKRILGQTLEHVRIASSFLLRTADPPLLAVEGKAVVQLRRLGKRICIGLENDLWPAALEETRSQGFAATRAGGLRFHERQSALDRSRLPEARFPARGLGSSRAALA